MTQNCIFPTDKQTFPTAVGVPGTSPSRANAEKTLIKIHVGPRSHPASRTQLAGLFTRLLAKPSDSDNEVW
jgi:hypothetical protein